MPSLGLAEGNRTSGGFPFLKKGEGGFAKAKYVPLLHEAFSNRLPAFFFETRGANENCFATLSAEAQAPSYAWQKRTRRKGSFASAEATNAPRVGSAPPFGKGGRKLI